MQAEVEGITDSPAPCFIVFIMIEYDNSVMAKALFDECKRRRKKIGLDELLLINKVEKKNGLLWNMFQNLHQLQFMR